MGRGVMNEPPIAIQILIPTIGAQHTPVTEGSHDFDTGAHWIQGMAALIRVMTFKDTIINQTKRLVIPDVSLKRVIANAVLVHPIAVRVIVARLSRISLNLV